MDEYASAADALRNKYNIPHSSTSKRQNTAAVSVINQVRPCLVSQIPPPDLDNHPQNRDTSYMGTVQIGTPCVYEPVISALPTQISNSPQSFNVVLDTGSSDLWVTDSGCTACTPGTPSFKTATSTSFQRGQDSTGQPVRVTITYGSGNVAGELVRDTVTMGGFQVQRQPWLLVDQTSASLLDGSDAGILGLAFSTIANTGSTPFWQSLAQGGQFSTPEMSFWLTRLLNNNNAQPEDFGGVFTLGGQNKTLYKGDVEFLPLVTSAGRQTYWLLTVSGTHLDPCFDFSYTPVLTIGITVNGNSVTLPYGNLAAIDTGTTLIGGPTDAVAAVYAQIPGSQQLSGNLAGFYGFRTFACFSSILLW